MILDLGGKIMRKKGCIFAIMLLMLIITLTACTSSFSYRVKVDTGDVVNITLDTSNGLKLSQDDGTFYVKKDGEDVLSCIFISPEQKDSYIDVVKNGGSANVIADTDNEFAWTVQGSAGTEHNKIIQVDNSNASYVLIASAYENEAIINEANNSISFVAE